MNTTLPSHTVCGGSAFPSREQFEVAGHQAFILPPYGAQMRGWVWYAPTRVGQLPDVSENLLLEGPRRSGFAVAGIDVGDFYGAPNGEDVFDQFYQEMTSTRGFDVRRCVFGRSRGGLEVFAWARRNPDLPRWIAGVYPARNLASYPRIDLAAAQFGVTDEQMQDMLSTVNPIDTYQPLVDAGIPVFTIHGDEDTIVPLEQNGQILHDRYAAAGGTITLKVAPGHGHDNWPG